MEDHLIVYSPRLATVRSFMKKRHHLRAAFPRWIDA
jgi:hypothetical protein